VNSWGVAPTEEDWYARARLFLLRNEVKQVPNDETGRAACNPLFKTADTNFARARLVGGEGEFAHAYAGIKTAPFYV
jgi:hypothetical protein